MVSGMSAVREGDVEEVSGSVREKILMLMEDLTWTGIGKRQEGEREDEGDERGKHKSRKKEGRQRK